VRHRLEFTSHEMEDSFRRLGMEPPRDPSLWNRALRDALLGADGPRVNRG
jgi:hypothetical protein